MRTLLCKTPLVFATGRKTIEGRLDVNYYKPEYREAVRKLKSSPFETRRLGDIVSISTERWKRPKAGRFKYIEINGIDTFSAQIIRAKELSIENAPSRAQMVIRKNDIIVSTTRPYRGAIALVTQEYDLCVCSTGFAIMRDLEIKMNRKYLLHVLHSNLGLRQMEQRMTGGNYPAITPDELLKILVPLPPIEIQGKIAQIMDKALQEKEEMEEKSEFLLRSVDDYLLQELRINLEEPKEESPLVYEIGARLLRSERWEVGYWKPGYVETEKAIKKGKYKTSIFGELIEKIVNGLDYRDFSEIGTTKYLRVGDIRPTGIDEVNIKCVPMTLDDINKDILLKKNDIILTRKGTFGIAVVVNNKDTQYIISSEIFRVVLRKDMEINAYYTVVVLNSSIGRDQISRKSVGAIMGSLSQEAVKSLLIPLPPRQVQDKIADEIEFRIERVKKLKDDSQKLLRNAKETIERIILGERDYEIR